MKQDDIEDFSVQAVIGVSGNSKIIPKLAKEQPITSDYIKALNDAIQSDGCTDSIDFYRDCCVAHDLGYEFAIDPWGNPITRAGTDANLRRCIQSKSKLGIFSPISWIRWGIVRMFGRFFYDPR